MSVFVDTGVFFAHHDTDADRHDQAVSAFDDLFDGEFGQPYTNDYVLDETVTLTRARTDSFEAADTVAGRILGEEPFPNVFRMIHVEPDDVRASLETLRRYEDHDLSFTDATIVALCESRGIDAVLSFDTDFDGLVDRIEPGHRSV
ncbi:type II toxin-antitoxin system VapC family toxin [Haloferax volcanii]|uniref:Ribonuclease VapC n=3 Tax=Haloferax volcanii TaxID=2246 RepID=A0A384KUP8_HALVD|nr:type II toxin-antitoxin system VapC family toxin [Haloferax volcanii]ADE01999.1 endonuclease VapC-like protein [Haloferax volcanii DS2]ELY32079.1 PIN domain protein [Haloferax volcanii DS2]MBS8120530.1 type II toxin-antitoxin system VapC family toxin [Haloferax volcanii]MBS8125567.1 type II toxin-antitoxin system VapC family toxin [Haloferax volcanii]MBS8129434.1 type II toxin-antitoxin system VapC family toxin [Haloferax volcanii]